MECAICGRQASMICIRCRRPICENCLDKTWYLCRECASLKWEIEADYHRRLNYLENVYSVSKEKAKIAQCKNCIILRELLISVLKLLREILDEARKEGFDEVERRARKLELKITNLLLPILIRQGIAFIDRNKGFIR